MVQVKKEELRQSILGAARSEFLGKGFRAASLRTIAGKAGCSPGNIYSYFAEAEREYISIRTKQGLAAAKAKGTRLGRPKGSKNKERVLDPYQDQIKSYLEMGLNLASISKIINNQLEKPLTYNSFKYFVQQNEELFPIWDAQKGGGTAENDPPKGKTT